MTGVDPSETFNVLAANPESGHYQAALLRQHCARIVASIALEVGTSDAAAAWNCPKGQRPAQNHTLPLSVIRHLWVKVHRIRGSEIEHAG
jgi:hypothetical protein